ncbi:MAG: SCP2 sterol-binding domain-containing protein [Myxococcales bacterium]|nr:SCP2 sterol-binding domain-containing protein [Myxococcales bacterium]
MAEPTAHPFLDEPDRFFMEWIPAQLAAHPAYRAQVGRDHAIAQIELAGERGGTWQVTMGDGQVEVARGPHAKPSFTIAMTVDTFRKLREGRIGIPGALLRGKIKARGSLGTLLKVGRNLKHEGS